MPYKASQAASMMETLLSSTENIIFFYKDENNETFGYITSNSLTGIYGTYKDLTFYDRDLTATEAHIDLPLNLNSLEPAFLHLKIS